MDKFKQRQLVGKKENRQVNINNNQRKKGLGS